MFKMTEKQPIIDSQDKETVIIEDGFLRNPKLIPEANMLYILMFILGKQGFKYPKSFFVTNYNITSDEYDRAIKNLIEQGFIVRIEEVIAQ